MHTTLRDRLPADLAAEFDAMWAEFLAAHPGSDVSAFLAQLHAYRQIDTAKLCELIGLLEVELTTTGAGPVVDEPPTALGVIGKGAMGEVLLAHDVSLNRHIAVKRLLPRAKGDPVHRRRFLQEVQIMAQLDHPAIVPVYSVETGADGVPAYAMKLVRGETLRDYLRVTRKQIEAHGACDVDHDLPARLDIFLQMCNAVHYAHTRGVIHRDLKPENIMIGAFGEVLVMDWGIARLIGRGPETTEGAATPTDETGTIVGAVIGTPAYMSPEQANGGASKLEGASDQYSLGLLLHELVCLKNALTGANLTEVLYRASQGERDPMVAAVSGGSVPRELEAIVAKATALQPNARYPHVDALADDVRRYLRDEPVSAAPDKPVQQATRWIARNRTTTLALVLALVMLLVAGVGVTVGAAATLLEARRQQAAEREAALAEVSRAVDGQARQIDARLQRYESLLTGLSFAASHALRSAPPSGMRLLLADDVREAPERVDSRMHRDQVTVDVPSFWRSPGTRDEDFVAAAPALAGLDQELRRAMLLSHSDDAERMPRAQYTALVAGEGVPVVWAYVALDNGVMITLPGAGGYPADYDPRTLDWYKRAHDRRTAAWNPADNDASDTSEIGLLMSVLSGVWIGDQSVGVAALDVSVHYVVDEVMAMPQLGVPVETWLIDEHGDTIVTSTALDQVPVFPHADALVARRDQRSGVLELGDAPNAKMVVWSRLEALDWTYVIVGSSAQLLGRGAPAAPAAP